MRSMKAKKLSPTKSLKSNTFSPTLSRSSSKHQYDLSTIPENSNVEAAAVILDNSSDGSRSSQSPFSEAIRNVTDSSADSDVEHSPENRPSILKDLKKLFSQKKDGETASGSRDKKPNRCSMPFLQKQQMGGALALFKHQRMSLPVSTFRRKSLYERSTSWLGSGVQEPEVEANRLEGKQSWYDDEALEESLQSSKTKKTQVAKSEDADIANKASTSKLPQESFYKKIMEDLKPDRVILEEDEKVEEKELTKPIAEQSRRERRKSMNIVNNEIEDHFKENLHTTLLGNLMDKLHRQEVDSANLMKRQISSISQQSQEIVRAMDMESSEKYITAKPVLDPKLPKTGPERWKMQLEEESDLVFRIVNTPCPIPNQLMYDNETLSKLFKGRFVNRATCKLRSRTSEELDDLSSDQRIEFRDAVRWLEGAGILDHVHLTLVHVEFCFSATSDEGNPNLTVEQFVTFLSKISQFRQMTLRQVVFALASTTTIPLPPGADQEKVTSISTQSGVVPLYIEN